MVKITKERSEVLKDALGYTIVYYSKEDQCWLAHCKSLDIMTHGDNETHAWEMIREAIELYLGFD